MQQNKHGVCRYVKESKVLVKIAGYADALNAKATDQVTPNGTSSEMQADGMFSC